MEHRLLLGGGEHLLPFARSCITKLKKLGLPYASQSFEIDGASVKVRVEPGHEYIRIEGNPKHNLLVVFKTLGTAAGDRNKEYEYLVYGTNAPALSKFKFLYRLAAWDSTTFGDWNGTPVDDAYDRMQYSFRGAYDSKVLAEKRHTVRTVTGAGPRFSWRRVLKGNVKTDLSIVLGTVSIGSAEGLSIDTRDQYYYWSKKYVNQSPNPPSERGEGYAQPDDWGSIYGSFYIVGVSSGPIGAITITSRNDSVPVYNSWNMVIGDAQSSTVTKSWVAGDNWGTFATATESSVISGVVWVEKDLDTKNKIRPDRKADMSFVPRTYTPVTITPPDDGIVRREALDFRHREVKFGTSSVVACCKEGFYNYSESGHTYFTLYRDAKNPIPIPPIAGSESAEYPVYYDDFMVAIIWNEDTGVVGNLSPKKGGLIFVAYSRVTGEEISAVAHTEVPLEESTFPLLNDPLTRFKRVIIPGLPAGSRFETMFRDELSCM